MEWSICMIINELSLVELIIKLIERSLNQSNVADILNLNARQVKQLVKKYRFDGSKGIIIFKYKLN